MVGKLRIHMLCSDVSVDAAKRCITRLRSLWFTLQWPEGASNRQDSLSAGPRGGNQLKKSPIPFDLDNDQVFSSSALTRGGRVQVQPRRAGQQSESLGVGTRRQTRLFHPLVSCNEDTGSNWTKLLNFCSKTWIQGRWWLLNPMRVG